MARRQYRVEVNYPKNKSPQYFLVRDVHVGNEKRKVRRYLCSGTPPSHDDVERYRKIYSYDLELKAAKKAGKLGMDFYKTEYLSKNYIDAIEEVRYLYKRFTESLTVDEIGVYEKQFELRYIQGTTAIEGNTLSVEEAEDLLNYGIIPKTKSLREINEIQNFKNVKAYRDSYKGKITLDFIRHLHAIIMHNISRNAGQFRKTDDIAIGGYEGQLCPSVEIENELQKIINYYYEHISQGGHPVEEAVMFHYFFETTHPFTNGNGRVGREIFNYMLSKNKYPKLLFLGKDRDQLYIQALREGNNEHYAEMITIFVEILLHQRLEILRDKLKTYIDEPKGSGQLTLASFITT
jgi:Fic family protein